MSLNGAHCMGLLDICLFLSCYDQAYYSFLLNFPILLFFSYFFPAVLRSSFTQVIYKLLVTMPWWLFHSERLLYFVFAFQQLMDRICYIDNKTSHQGITTVFVAIFESIFTALKQMFHWQACKVSWRSQCFGHKY